MSNIFKGINNESDLPPRAGFNKKPKQKGPGYHKDDYEYTEFVPRDKKERGEQWAIKRDVMKQKVKKSEPKSMDTGFYKNYLGNRPVREGEVVSLAAKRSPLVIAGSPYDWDIYDLRTNQRVANILGGDRHDIPLYEIRINSSGMTSTKMPPTYVLRAGPNNTPPYKAYELVAPEGGFGKIEKSPGPGGTTKLHPDKDDTLRHMMKNLGGGKYYGYDLDLVEEGLNQYQLVEKALGAKIMEVDDAMELGYTDWDPNDSSSIVYLGNKKEKVDELRKETISNYLSQQSAAVRGGKQERPKKVPSWKVAAGKLYPDKAMGKYAKVPASGIMQGVAETTSTGTSVGSAGIGGGSGIGVEASPIVQAFQNQIDEDTIRPNLAAKLKELGFKGPFKLSQLPKWSKDLIQDDEYAFDADTSIMVRGNDPTLDEFVAKTYDYGYIYGAEGGLNVRISAEEVLDRVSPVEEGKLGRALGAIGLGTMMAMNPAHADVKTSNLNVSKDGQTTNTSYTQTGAINRQDSVYKAIYKALQDNHPAYDYNMLHQLSDLAYRKYKATGELPSEIAKEDVSEAYQYDESNLMYKYDSQRGRLVQAMIQNRDENSARSSGYRDTPEQALRTASIIRSKFDPKKFVQKVGNKWVEVFPYGKPDVEEHINSPGGMGQAYRKIEVKGPAGLEENLLNTYGDQFGFPKESSVMKGMQEAEKDIGKIPTNVEHIANALIATLGNPANKYSPDQIFDYWKKKLNLKFTLNDLFTWVNDYKKYELEKAIMAAKNKTHE